MMLDETIITETPPLYNCYGPIGEQVRVPISGEHAKRVLHGAINIRSGDLALLITEDWTKTCMRRSSRRFVPIGVVGTWWSSRIVRANTRRPGSGRQESLKIETRLLPRATPELNAMDHLWRHAKRETLGDRATLSIEASALAACQYLIDLSPHDRLQKAGVLSGHFWLTL